MHFKRSTPTILIHIVAVNPAYSKITEFKVIQVRVVVPMTSVSPHTARKNIHSLTYQPTTTLKALH